MSKRIDTIKGLFGQLIHYQDGVKIGESWSGLFQGSYDHYDANGTYAGYSDPGIVADLVHHDASGSYIGETHDGICGQKTHYDLHGYAGSSYSGLFGNDISIINDIDE